jgi:uncharacterized membrane protein
MKYIRRLFEGRKINLWQDIAACVVLHILLIALILAGLLPALRAVLSLLCLLFTPGYATLAMFFPGGKDIDPAARFGLSPVVSVAVLIPIGLALNYSIWGLSVEAILAGITGYVVLCGMVALWRRSGISPELRYSFPWPGTKQGAAKLLPLIVILTILGIAVWGYFERLIAESAGERYTEFYILSPDGVAGQYPQQTVVGEPVTVIIGITNHEHDAVLYHVVLMEADGSLQRIASIPLEDNQSWEQPCTFALTVPGEKNRISFLLYREGDNEPYRSLQLWITVLETPESIPKP